MTAFFVSHELEGGKGGGRGKRGDECGRNVHRWKEKVWVGKEKGGRGEGNVQRWETSFICYCIDTCTINNHVSAHESKSLDFPIFLITSLAYRYHIRVKNRRLGRPRSKAMCIHTHCSSQCVGLCREREGGQQGAADLREGSQGAHKITAVEYMSNQRTTSTLQNTR